MLGLCWNFVREVGQLALLTYSLSKNPEVGTYVVVVGGVVGIAVVVGGVVGVVDFHKSSDLGWGVCSRN